MGRTSKVSNYRHKGYPGISCFKEVVGILNGDINFHQTRDRRKISEKKTQLVSTRKGSKECIGRRGPIHSPPGMKSILEHPQIHRVRDVFVHDNTYYVERHRS